MNRIWIEELPKYLHQEVTVEGWLHRVRKLGKLAFLLIKDTTGMVQGVVTGKPEWLQDIAPEQAVRVHGSVSASNQQALGVELQISEIVVLGKVYKDLPFELNQEEIGAGLEHVLDHRVLSLRHPKTAAIFKIQDGVIKAFRDFLHQEKFTEIHTPKIVATGTEGGSELFEIKYFEQTAYLAQSPQFYKQMAMGAGLQRVFEVAPVYRAEPHNTSRHLSEFISLDLEMGFISGLNDVLSLEERLLEYVFAYLQEYMSKELAMFQAQLPKVGQIPRLRIKEIDRILQKEYGKALEILDLDSESERLICEYMMKETGSEFVFATHYGKANRPMYTQPCADDQDVTESFDMLFRGLEMNSGAQRVHDYDVLVHNIREKGLQPESFASYLEIFQYGMPPHGGFAIGAERLVCKILGLQNIREAVLFPRDRFRLTP